MRIDTRPVVGAGASAPARRARAPGGFAVSDADAAGAPARAGAAAPVATLDAILALQGEEDPAERRRRAASRGRDLLDGLDRLKAALLAGRVAPGDVAALRARLSERAEASGEPGLDSVLAQIELRAEVELAKLARAREAASAPAEGAAPND